jgi:hypothetical protein
VGGGSDDEDDVFSRQDPAIPMDDGDAEQRPAALGRLDVTCDFGFRHPRIMLERHGNERSTRFVLSADAGEGDDGADITAAQLRHLARGIERLALQSDGAHLRLRLVPR